MKVTNKLLLIGLLALLFSFHSVPSAPVSNTEILVATDENTDYDINDKTENRQFNSMSITIINRI